MLTRWAGRLPRLLACAHVGDGATRPSMDNAMSNALLSRTGAAAGKRRAGGSRRGLTKPLRLLRRELLEGARQAFGGQAGLWALIMPRSDMHRALGWVPCMR
jgi:hypothetical protein